MILSRMLEFAVILHWHGVWSTMDIVMEDMMEMTRVQSSWLSLVIGWSMAILLFIFQFPLLIIYRRCRSQMSKNGYYIIFQVYIILGMNTLKYRMFLKKKVSGMDRACKKTWIT